MSEMIHHQELASIPCDKDAPSLSPQEESKAVAYSNVINFPRTNSCGSGADCGPSCVMCGRIDGRDCTIPNQNKNVCNSCDSLRWYNTSQRLEFKFCKGCKNFICIFDFAEKPFASKCSKCRLRSRTSYFSRRAEKGSASAGRPSDAGSMLDGSSGSTKGHKRKYDGSDYLDGNGGAMSLPMPSYTDDDMFALLSTPTLYGSVYPSMKATPPLHPLTASRKLASDMTDNTSLEMQAARASRGVSPLLSDSDRNSRVLSELADSSMNSADYTRDRRQSSSKVTNSSWMLNSATRVSSPDGLVSRGDNASLLSSRLNTNYTGAKANHSHLMKTSERYNSPLNIFGFTETPRAHNELDYHLLGSLTTYINSCEARSPVAETIRSFEPSAALSACADTPYASNKAAPSLQPAAAASSTGEVGKLPSLMMMNFAAADMLNADVGAAKAQKSWENLFEDNGLDKDLLKSPPASALPTGAMDGNAGWYSATLFSTAKGDKIGATLSLASPVSAAFDGFGMGLDTKKRSREVEGEGSMLLQNKRVAARVN